LTNVCVFVQSKAKAEKNQAMEHQMHEGACPLCAVEKLTFEPPPIYCTACGIRIKRNASYYTTGSGDTRHYFCVPCYNDVRTENVEMEGQTYPKSRLERRRNDEETEEAVGISTCLLFFAFFFTIDH
jgi:E1A/CREB-binding protein